MQDPSLCFSNGMNLTGGCSGRPCGEGAQCTAQAHAAAGQSATMQAVHPTLLPNIAPVRSLSIFSCNRTFLLRNSATLLYHLYINCRFHPSIDGDSTHLPSLLTTSSIHISAVFLSLPLSLTDSLTHSVSA